MAAACWERGILALICFLLWGIGCTQDERLEEQRMRLQAQQSARLEALERVEARLLGAAARKRGWGELQRRRAEVTEIACENAAFHASAMERHLIRQEARARAVRLASRQVAEARREGSSSGSKESSSSN